MVDQYDVYVPKSNWNLLLHFLIFSITISGALRSCWCFRFSVGVCCFCVYPSFTAFCYFIWFCIRVLVLLSWEFCCIFHLYSCWMTTLTWNEVFTELTPFTSKLTGKLSLNLKQKEALVFSLLEKIIND